MLPLRLHLALAHAPVFIVCFGLILLIVSWVRVSRELERAGLVTLIASGFVTIPVFFSGWCIGAAYGDPAQAERLTTHEAAALPALVSALLLALVSLVIHIACRRRMRLPVSARIVTLILGILVLSLLLRATRSGGEIRHGENPISSGPVGFEPTQEAL